MKLFHQYLIVLILGLFQIVLAVQVQKPIVVSYPDNTPDSVLNEAKKAITDAVSDLITRILKVYTELIVFRAAGSLMNSVSFLIHHLSSFERYTNYYF